MVSTVYLCKVQFEHGLSLCLICILVKTYAVQYGSPTGPNELEFKPSITSQE